MNIINPTYKVSLTLSHAAKAAQDRIYRSSLNALEQQLKRLYKNVNMTSQGEQERNLESPEEINKERKDADKTTEATRKRSK